MSFKPHRSSSGVAPRRLVASWLFAVLALTACGATGEPAFQAPLRARGGPGELVVGAWTVSFTRADLGLGPIYLCATAAASADLCPNAVAEYPAVATVDALDPEVQELGDLDALPAQARSAMFDYGRTWLKVQPNPGPQEGAPGGHAARFAGRAVQGAQAVEFTADLDVEPVLRGSRTVEGLRVGPFDLDPGGGLDLAVDAARWWNGVDFDELAALGPGPHDLTALAAADPAGPAAAALDVVRFAMISAPPTFTWNSED